MYTCNFYPKHTLVYMNTQVQNTCIHKTNIRKCIFLHTGINMKTLRIKETQEEKIRQLAISFNKKLVQMGKQPMRDSELVHELLNSALEKAVLTEQGSVEIKK